MILLPPPLPPALYPRHSTPGTNTDTHTTRTCTGRPTQQARFAPKGRPSPSDGGVPVTVCDGDVIPRRCDMMWQMQRRSLHWSPIWVLVPSRKPSEERMAACKYAANGVVPWSTVCTPPPPVEATGNSVENGHRGDDGSVRGRRRGRGVPDVAADGGPRRTERSIPRVLGPGRERGAANNVRATTRVFTPVQ